MERVVIHRLTLFAILYLFVASCATPRSGRVIEQGEASWYGPGFHGKKTANGEVYNQNELTAAHLTLPFNTVVKVVNLNNNKAVNVRINDRGPYARGRIIDLSRAAAQNIDMLESGIAPVRLTLVKSDEPLKTRGAGNIRQQQFTIQIASFHNRNDAESLAERIRNSRIRTADVNGKQVFRVHYGIYPHPNAARRDLERLKNRGHDGYIRQLQN